VKRGVLLRLLEARGEKDPVVLVTELASGRQGLVFARPGDAGHDFHETVQEAARRALGADRSGIHEAENGDRYFLHVFNPPLRLLIVGAVHIAQSLAPMAALVGYDVTVVDPRGAFATVERFPGVHICDDWPDDALEVLSPDTRTAVVTLTHDPKLDDPALVGALRSRAFYIGCLGSRRTHQGRLRRLTKAGFGEADLARLHGPVGLAIGAESPAEIAMAIVAEMTRVLRLGRAE
jgi:xanthine dehydrogenase accessory factor